MSTNHTAETSKKENTLSTNVSRFENFRVPNSDKLISAKNSKPPPDKTDNTDLSLVTDEDFIKQIFPILPDNAFPAVCSKPGDPTEGGWVAMRADGTPLPVTNNNYLSCSTYYDQEDESFRAIKERFAAYHCILFDDVGTKISFERFGNFEFSWLIETSPGNFQGGIILDEPDIDIEVAERLIKAIMAKGLSDEGASGVTRWLRLPQAINGKDKYKDGEGKSFRCRLAEWRPNKRYSLQEIIDRFELELEPKKAAVIHHVTQDTITPQVGENKVVAALKDQGLYKKSLGSGKHDIICPWVDEHTDKLDNGAGYFEPSEDHPYGGFKCHHSHGDKLHIQKLLEFLGLSLGEACVKTVIRVAPGELEYVVDTAERVLANSGNYYQAGGLIVSVTKNPATGDSSILPIGMSELTRQLSVLAIWEKPGPSAIWTRCDPSSKHVKILSDSNTFKYLPPLTGIARQPYFRESDNELIMEPGYDKGSMMFGVFDASSYPIPPDPTEAEARAALALLEDLLVEFRFVSANDKAAALSAIFTAVVRSTLPHAPAFHVRAPSSGSGKSYLCKLIGAFAGPGVNAPVSYPNTPEEATKAILSLLLVNPAVIEFDDMVKDWTPHGSILRMLTAEHITDRILGVSKTATVSTRTLFLGSGNNVGPIGDLLRRVLTIHINPRCATPSMISYIGAPVEKVRQQRGRYVAAVMTIISAWRNCGSPRTDAGSIVTYNGAWTDYCRQTLLWLGLPDPATALFEQVTHDPHADALGRLMSEWNRLFGSNPTTVRQAVETAGRDDDFMDAINEYPIVEKGFINTSRFGWLLKKNANRIVNGFEFQRVDAPQRTAWRVVAVATGDDK